MTQPEKGSEAPPPFTFTKWWEEHKDEKNNSRRTRYRNDPVYRNGIKQQNASSRRRRAQVRKAEQAAETEAKRFHAIGHSWKMFDVTLQNPDGTTRVVSAVTIGALAAATQRSVQGLRLWESQKVIPLPDATSPRGDRLYTIELIEKIVNDLRAQGRLTPTKRQGRGTPKVEKVVRFANGETKRMVLLQVAAVAKVLQRSNVAVQSMESRGVIPPTPLRATKREYRLYTIAQVEALQKRFEELDCNLRSEEAQRQFRDRVQADWTRQGIDGAVIIEEDATIVPRKEDSDG